MPGPEFFYNFGTWQQHNCVLYKKETEFKALHGLILLQCDS